MTDKHYPFQSTDDERQRLIVQAALVQPLTERLFEKAGINRGMRVLDIGSGSGDVSLLAAQFVGPEGSVIGVDQDPAQVEFAERRVEEIGSTNIRFLTGDFGEIVIDQPLDAIVGRLVLMYTTDPVESLRCVTRNLRPGGVIALQESVIEYDGPVPIEPLDCLAARVVEWFRAGFRHAGVQPRMGMRLPGLMRAAGLVPCVDVDTLVPVQQGPDGPLFRLLVSVVRSQLPAIVASGIATEAEIDIETLEQRLIDDAPANGVVGYFHSGHVGVWAKKP